MQDWAAAAVHQLQELAATLQQQQQQQQHLASGTYDAGGALVLQPYHQRFEQLYRCWLALLAASRLPHSSSSWGGSTAAAVAELAAGAVGAEAAASSVPQLAAVAGAAAAAWRQRSEGTSLASDVALLFLV